MLPLRVRRALPKQTRSHRPSAGLMISHAVNQTHEIGAVIARRHEVDELDRAICCLEDRHEDKRAIELASCNPGSWVYWRDEPSSVLRSAKQGSEARARIETGPAKPVDGQVAPYEGRRLAIADDRIILNVQRHRSALGWRFRKWASTRPEDERAGRRAVLD